MGATYVTTTLRPVHGSSEGYTREFLVDTGATDCIAPASELVKIGIVPKGSDVYSLADGQSVEFKYGFAEVEFLGSTTVTQVIFGPEDVEPILGVVALENTGIAVDPRTGTLRRLAAKLLKSVRRRTL